MGNPKEMKAKPILIRLLQKIERDGRRAGLSSLAIRQLQQDCEKVFLNNSQFLI